MLLGRGRSGGRIVPGVVHAGIGLGPSRAHLVEAAVPGPGVDGDHGLPAFGPVRGGVPRDLDAAKPQEGAERGPPLRYSCRRPLTERVGLMTVRRSAHARLDRPLPGDGTVLRRTAGASASPTRAVEAGQAPSRAEEAIRAAAVRKPEVAERGARRGLSTATPRSRGRRRASAASVASRGSGI